MRFFPNTTFHDVPMLGGELDFWLSKGRKAFRHRGQVWMQICHFAGHRQLVSVSDCAIEYCRHRIVERGPVISYQHVEDEK